ncbi:hypothetical protein P5V15_001642 [Pogonomyrmex californicus]
MADLDGDGDSSIVTGTKLLRVEASESSCKHDTAPQIQAVVENEDGDDRASGSKGSSEDDVEYDYDDGGNSGGGGGGGNGGGNDDNDDNNDDDETGDVDRDTVTTRSTATRNREHRHSRSKHHAAKFYLQDVCLSASPRRAH